MFENSITKDSVYVAHHGDVSCDIQCRNKHVPILVVLESPWHMERFLQRPATGRTGSVLCAIFEEVRKNLPTQFMGLFSVFCTREAGIVNVSDNYLPFKEGQCKKRMTAQDFVRKCPNEYQRMIDNFRKKLGVRIDLSSIQVVLLMGQLAWGAENCFQSSSTVVQLYHPSYVANRKEFGNDVVMRTKFVAAYICHCLKHSFTNNRKFPIERFVEYVKLNRS